MIAKALKPSKRFLLIASKRSKVLSAFKDCYTVRGILSDEQCYDFNRLYTVRESLLSAFLTVCNLLKSFILSTVHTVIYKESWLATLVGHASLTSFNTIPKFRIFKELVNGSLGGFSNLLCLPLRWSLYPCSTAPRTGVEMVGFSFILRLKKNLYTHPDPKYRYKPLSVKGWCQVPYSKPCYLGA